LIRLQFRAAAGTTTSIQLRSARSGEVATSTLLPSLFLGTTNSLLLFPPAGTMWTTSLTVFFKLLRRGGVRWWSVQRQREVVAGHRRVCHPVRMNGIICSMQMACLIFSIGNGRHACLPVSILGCNMRHDF
jgi:hypothetical protein